MAAQGNDAAGTNGAQNGAQNGSAQTFTQEQVNAIVGERLSRQAEKFADYDNLKQKAAEYDRQQEANKSELQKAQEKAQKLEDKIAGMEKADKIRGIRAKVSKDTGVPEGLLTGEDEETCKSQAESILKFAKGSKYPGVKEEPHTKTHSKSAAEEATTEEFKELAGQIFGRKE